MAEVASAFVSLIPSARGFKGGIERQIGGDVDAAGRTSGKRLGEGMRVGAVGAIGRLAGPIGAAFAAAGIGSFFKGAFDEAQEARKVGALTAQVVKSTGGAANVTAGQVEALAGRLSDLAGVDDEVIQAGSNLLLTFTNVRNGVGKGNAIFDQATTAALNMSTALGTDMNSAALQVGKALNDPVKGLTALGRAGVSFTDQQKKQIKGFVAAGNTMAAQKIILGELTKEFGGAAAAAATPADKAATAWGNFKEKVGGALAPVADDVLTKFADMLDKVDEFAGTLRGAAGDVKGFFDRFKTDGAALTGFATSLGGILGPGLRAIGDIIKTQVLPAFNAFLPAVMPIVRFFAGIFGSAIKGALQGALKVIKGVLGIIAGVMNTIAGLLTGNWSRAWTGIKQIFSGAFKVITGALQVWLSVGVIGLFRKGFTLLGSAARAGWNAIRQLFTSAVSAISSLLGRLPGLMLGLFRSAFNAARGAVSSGITGVVAFFRALPGRIVSALSSLGSALYGIGRDIVQGLINGIRSIGGSIKDALLNLLPGPLRKFAGALGINSPSTVFAGFGRNIGEGLVLGVRSQQAAVERAVAALAVIPGGGHGLGAAVRLNGVTPAAGASINVVQNFPPPVPERAVRYAVGDALALAVR